MVNVAGSLLLAMYFGYLGFFLAYPYVYYLVVREAIRKAKAMKQRAKDGWETSEEKWQQLMKELAKNKEKPTLPP